MALTVTAKKRLVASAVDSDLPRIDRVEACISLIRGCRLVEFDRLIAVCFPDMNPDSEQFDLLCDSWDAYQAIERNRASEQA